MNEYVALVLGIVCAGIGGEHFVRGTVGLAGLARISPGIVGVTFAAFATSSPELSVSISSALAEQPQIALGDALGSNVVNIALIPGLVLVISGIQSPRDNVKRDFPVAILIPLVTVVLLLDGRLSRIDGALMICMFIAWIVAAIREARKQRSASTEVSLGTVLGSNIFNGIFIVAIAALIHPIVVPLADVVATLVFGILALVLVFPPGDGFIKRRRGVLLISLYIGYLVTALQGGAA